MVHFRARFVDGTWVGRFHALHEPDPGGTLSRAVCGRDPGGTLSHAVCGRDPGDTLSRAVCVI